MLSLSASQTSGPVSPVYVPDLRPVADAAAMNRQAEPVTPVSGPPAAAFPPVAPPSAVAQGVVGRSLLAAVSMSGADVSGGEERRLKPWGVTMLPSTPPEPEPEPEAAPKAASGWAGSAGQAAADIAAAVTQADPPAREMHTEAEPVTVRHRPPEAPQAAQAEAASPSPAEGREPSAAAEGEAQQNERTRDDAPRT
jgi:hypothetical protein